MNKGQWGKKSKATSGGAREVGGLRLASVGECSGAATMQYQKRTEKQRGAKRHEA